MKPIISFEKFSKVDIRIGTIMEVTDFPKAHKSAYQLKVDFGKLGVKNTSAQITSLYSKNELLGKKVMAIVNFKEKQIANFQSQVLLLGIQIGSNVVLLQSSKKDITNGEQIS